jgi:hypothetical protein
MAVMVSSSVYAGSPVNKMASNPIELNWQFDKTASGVDFFYAISSCDGQDVVFLKMKNKNKYSVEISWKEVFQTQLAKKKLHRPCKKWIDRRPILIFHLLCTQKQRHVDVVS